jgi:succinate dehydrogenase / fumarate reductase flavoprotein subunit
VYLDFADAIKRKGKDTWKPPMATCLRCMKKSRATTLRSTHADLPRRALYHGWLWVDYELMTTVPALYACGEANFSDHGANRLGASALMQGLADGYFVLPYTIGSYLSKEISTGPILYQPPGI